jgi:hypothetical protein
MEWTNLRNLHRLPSSVDQYVNLPGRRRYMIAPARLYPNAVDELNKKERLGVM